ncbi:MAG: hypothetical protein PGN22_02675 [Agrobacterium cavarae]
MTAWKSMDDAPIDRDILLKTSDFGVVQGRWDMQVTNFYKSQEGWASFDPDNAQGDWVSDFYVSARVSCLVDTLIGSRPEADGKGIDKLTGGGLIPSLADNADDAAASIRKAHDELQRLSRVLGLGV